MAGRYCDWFIGGKEVARRTYSPDAYLQDLEVRPDDLELHTTVTDATRIVCRFCDQLGNALPLYNGILQIETAGDVAVIGPDDGCDSRQVLSRSG